MPHFYLNLVENGQRLDDPEGMTFADVDAATVNAIYQIRSMVSCELLESGGVNLARAIEIFGDDGISRRVQFAEAISVSI